jgi:hypothetical protein
MAAKSSATPASGSTSGGKTSAAAAAMVTGPAGAKPATEMPLTPGLEQLDEAQIAAAFMGLPVETGTKKQKQATNKETEGDEGDADEGDADEGDADEGDADEGDADEGDADEGDADEGDADEGDADEGDADEGDADEGDADEGDADEGDADEGDADEGKSALDKGLDKALKNQPGLRKRIKGLMAENPRLKRELAEAKTQLEKRGAEPEIVTATSASNPFAAARSDAEVDRLADEMVNDAEDKLDWLDNHREGGTYGKGENAVEMDADDVANARAHYRKVLRGVEAAKTARKDWLKSFAETRSKLNGVAAELLSKDSDLPEAKLLRAVPEIMRNADFLQTLADAKAGREQREKAAKGIKFVEVKAGKVIKPQGKSAETDPKGGKPATGKKVEPGERKPLTQAALDKLRADADAGDKRAQQKLDQLFLAS